MRVTSPEVFLIGATEANLTAMRNATGGRWAPVDGEPCSGGELVAEFAGRACYQSWAKPNPATATNAGYLQHILDVEHYSVLEHGTVTFYLVGMSRSLTHELIRHRHFSYSQLSQRYVDSAGSALVVPPLFDQDDQAMAILGTAQEGVEAAYEALTARAEELLADRDLSTTARRKQARQAARAVLPNATETRIVMTGNYRAWRHFIRLRASEHADTEIRALAVEVLRQLQRHAPHVFGDFRIRRLDDGTEVAETDHAEDS